MNAKTNNESLACKVHIVQQTVRLGTFRMKQLGEWGKKLKHKEVPLLSLSQLHLRIEMCIILQAVYPYVMWKTHVQDGILSLDLLQLSLVIRKLYVPDRMMLTSSYSFYSSKKSKRPKADNSLQ